MLVYIAADVPTDDQGLSDISGIRALIETVAAGLERDAILVILCQVPPGFTRHLSLPKERLYYQVETLIFGRAVERAMYRSGSSLAAPILPDHSHRPSRRSYRFSDVRSYPCATRAPSWRRSRSTVVSSRRSLWQIRWLDSVSGSARTGRRSRQPSSSTSDRASCLPIAGPGIGRRQSRA